LTPGGAKLDAGWWVAYCETVKNITVSLDDETYRNARIKAAALDTSVSALVKRYLTELAGGETEFQQLKRLQRELLARIPGEFRAADRLPRDQVHERGA
jgi:ABC-type hemin transport system ATPase subunit